MISTLDELLGAVSTLLDRDRRDVAMGLLIDNERLTASHPVMAKTLAFLLLDCERWQEAVGWFDRVLAVLPDDPSALDGLGMALIKSGGAGERALACFEKVVVLKPADASAWYHRGVLLADQGQTGLALISLERAIQLDPDYALAIIKKGNLLDATGDLQGALHAAARALELAPEEASAWCLFADVMQKRGQFDKAIEGYDQGLSLSPDDFYCLCNKAQALEKTERLDEALQLARRALAQKPDNVDALLLCGHLEKATGNEEAAYRHFLAASRQGVVRRYRAAGPGEKLKALMLFAPFAGNTPYEDMVEGASFDADLILVLPGAEYDVESLRASADVVVNLVSDVDLSAAILEPVRALVDALALPVVNPPLKIAGTDREAIAARLKDIPATVLPETRRVTADELEKAVEQKSGLHFPLILRHAGTHGGDLMEKIDDENAMLAFSREAGGQDLYLTDYVDYASADGLYRKYRWVFVGEEILPYHLAIGYGWKVHHASTRMAEVEWMRDEEKDFLDDPRAFFEPDVMAALETIRNRIGLDYFGIDCGLDRQGRLVVFEVNASMLVHLRNYGFEYKNPYVLRIKQAFARMLAEVAKTSAR
ncbi:tetratricopeptide repeat protein [Allorhizobium sonneratiae]|uniref:tetratricopeptide repeat protein n=1 Tax=Allorhizobium sonneratiae TaxID=2934936 RepID=UPI002034535F|nr:tetratricopeptide repeat protein [Allorhizobium sonneratiae]